MKPDIQPGLQIFVKNLPISKELSLKNWNLTDQRVILRVDFNVPIKNGVIQDDTRIKRSLPTLLQLIQQNAKIIILSHLGRPLKDLDENGCIKKDLYSLKPIADKLSELLSKPVEFAEDCGGPLSLAKASALNSGHILLLENTRFLKGEEKGDTTIAENLARLGSYYINDAFGAAHREHSSTATIARSFDKDHKSFGLLMEEEVKSAARVLENPERPFTAIIGGAKVSDKIELISNLMNLCDHIIIGGGMAYTFLKAQGYSIGKSLCEPEKLELAKTILEEAERKGTRINLPLDSVMAVSIQATDSIQVSENENIHPEMMGLDIGPKTIRAYSDLIGGSKTIIWNGPMGVFEVEAFSMGTKSIAEAVAKATSLGAFSLIGGGDSVAAINKFDLSDQVSYVSTGGGAMLEMLEGKILPGIQAIQS